MPNTQQSAIIIFVKSGGNDTPEPLRLDPPTLHGVLLPGGGLSLKGFLLSGARTKVCLAEHGTPNPTQKIDWLEVGRA